MFRSAFRLQQFVFRLAPYLRLSRPFVVFRLCCGLHSSRLSTTRASSHQRPPLTTLAVNKDLLSKRPRPKIKSTCRSSSSIMARTTIPRTSLPTRTTTMGADHGGRPDSRPRSSIRSSSAKCERPRSSSLRHRPWPRSSATSSSQDHSTSKTTRCSARSICSLRTM